MRLHHVLCNALNVLSLGRFALLILTRGADVDYFELAFAHLLLDNLPHEVVIFIHSLEAARHLDKVANVHLLFEDTLAFSNEGCLEFF